MWFRVGVVVVKDGYIFVIGYNGVLRGMDYCIDVGCFIVDGYCYRVVYVE